jgi:hypothetical protein
MVLSSGARLGPYEVVEPLGRGGMGEVYRARDTRLGRDVAIKVLPARTASFPDALARFEFEARAVAALNHPNILALHDVGTADGVSYAVLELLEGETLRDRLRDGPLPPRKALDLAAQLARGLAAAHAQGIVHRDLKPENVFLTGDGRVKILDFGIAVHEASSQAASVAETRYATETGTLVGTVGYMAPEQVRGEPASPRSDVFSFGLVIHEAVRGSNPFERETLPETMAAILRDQAESLALVPGLPPIAARILDRCLEKRPEDRPESMRDLAFLLDTLAVSPASEASRPDQPYRGTRRIAVRILAGACALLALLTAATWAYVRAGVNRAQADLVSADRARVESSVLRAQQDRLERLRQSARLVASIPQLKALFATRDAPTIRDFLQVYQRNPGTPLWMALWTDGYLLARTDEGAATVPDVGQEWLKALRAAGDAGVITVNGRSYHAAVANAEAGGSIFGSVIAAAPVDSAFAQVLREVTQAEAILLDAQGMAGTSLRSGQVPWDTLDAFRSAAGSAGSREVTVGAARFTAREVSLAEAPPVVAVILAPHDAARGSSRGIQSGVLTVGLAGIALTLLAGLLTIRRLDRRNPGAAR